MVWVLIFSQFTTQAVFGQSCDVTISANELNEYLRESTAGKVNGSNSVSTNNAMWEKKVMPNTSHVAKFTRKGSFTWEATSNDPVKIKGIVLEPGIDLTIGRANNNETPAFEIIGGVITVKAGSKLNFEYFTKLEKLTICVEDGGKLFFNSTASGGSAGERDDFLFKDVTINLNGPGASLEFDDADIILDGTIKVNGWTGTEHCTGNTPPAAGKSGNIKWTNNTFNICPLIGASVLPVELYAFTIDKKVTTRETQLSWTTAKEWDNSHFEIERSINGISSWETIAQISGAGYSDRLLNYNYTDSNLPASGGNIYYRLKQVDFNGEGKYSETRSINLEAINSKGTWTSYPNPSVKGQTIHIDLLNKDSYSNEEIFLQISNVMGTISEVKNLNNPSDVEKEVNNFLSNQKQGAYLVKLVWGNFNQTMRIQVN